MLFQKSHLFLILTILSFTLPHTKAFLPSPPFKTSSISSNPPPATTSLNLFDNRLEVLGGPINRFIETITSKVSGTSLAEKVLQNPKFPPEWPYDEEDFRRMDETDDDYFYDYPRLVYHIDDAARAALTNYYGQTLEVGEDVLDICSSWVSHYPKGWNTATLYQGAKVVGLGMNEQELKQNSQLSDYVVKDLNKDPAFPFEDASFDKVTCVVSIDYLNRPRQIFDEIGRVLRPGGECIISLSNRCFPTKAFQMWLWMGDLERIFIVGSFFHYSGLFEEAECVDISPNPGWTDPLYIVKAKRKES